VEGRGGRTAIPKYVKKRGDKRIAGKGKGSGGCGRKRERQTKTQRKKKMYK